MVDPGRLELVGACNDPKSVLGPVGLRGAVDYTVIDGEVTVENGAITGIDEEKVGADSNKELGRYLASV